MLRRLPALLLAAALPACTMVRPVAFSVFFAPLSSSLDARAKGTIAYAARLANASPYARLRLAGYSGAQGPIEDELRLAGRRAEAVERQLIADGVAPARIRREVHAPIAYPNPAQARRVDIAIAGP
jgi:outer membrane protein OmpA-like peptidoglycan-associated protein